MKNKILLIGGASFIGSEFIKKFKNQYKIFADKSKFRNKKLNLSFKLSETKKINDIVKKNDISIIIHLASSIYAYSNLNDFKNEKKKLINPTVKLIRSLNDNIKFIFISSGGTVYGSKKNATEKSETKTVNYLAKAKILIEKKILYYFSRKKNFNFLILRPSNIYGYKKNVNNKQGIIDNSILAIIQNKEIILRNQGKDLRDYLYVIDFIKVLKKLIDTDIKNQILNVSSGFTINTADIVKKICKMLKKKPKIIFLKKNNKDKISHISLSNKKLLKLVNFKFVNLDKGLKKIIRKFKS